MIAVLHKVCSDLPRHSPTSLLAVSSEGLTLSEIIFLHLKCFLQNFLRRGAGGQKGLHLSEDAFTGHFVFKGCFCQIHNSRLTYMFSQHVGEILLSSGFRCCHWKVSSQPMVVPLEVICLPSLDASRIFSWFFGILQFQSCVFVMCRTESRQVFHYF